MLHQLADQAQTFVLVQQISHFHAVGGQPDREQELHLSIAAHFHPLESATQHKFSQPNTTPTHLKPNKINAFRASV